MNTNPKSMIYRLGMVLTLVSFMQFTNLKAQDVWTWTSAYLNSGSFMSDGVRASNQDFMKLAPDAAFFSEDIGLYSNYGWFSDNPILQNYWLGFQKSLGSGNLIQEIRVGFTMGNVRLLTINNRYSLRNTIDTLTLSNRGDRFPVDSTYRRDYNFDYTINTIMLDVSYLIRGRNFGRWYFYGGLGVGLGFNYTASTIATFNESYEIKYQIPNYRHSDGERSYTISMDNNIGDNQEEIFTHSNSMAARLNIPLGISLQLGKKNNFWRHVALFTESAPGLLITRISELDRNILLPNVFGSLGLRIDINP